MRDQRKEFISDTALLIWVFVSGICTIGCILISAFIHYLIYDCWIMYQHQLAGGNCSSAISIPVAIGIPVIAGLIIGTLITRKILK